jgi:hypothetical protein
MNGQPRKSLSTPLQNLLQMVVGNTAVIILSEAQQSVTKLEATDPDGDPLQFLVSGGDDQAQFVVNQETKILQFANLPDFENPADSNGDNLYSLEVIGLRMEI